MVVRKSSPLEKQPKILPFMCLILLSIYNLKHNTSYSKQVHFSHPQWEKWVMKLHLQVKSSQQWPALTHWKLLTSKNAFNAGNIYKRLWMCESDWLELSAVRCLSVSSGRWLAVGGARGHVIKLEAAVTCSIASVSG